MAIENTFNKGNTSPRNNVLKWGVYVLFTFYLSDIFSLGLFCKEVMEDSNSLSPSPGRQELNKKYGLESVQLRDKKYEELDSCLWNYLQIFPISIIISSYYNIEKQKATAILCSQTQNTLTITHSSSTSIFQQNRKGLHLLIYKSEINEGFRI